MRSRALPFGVVVLGLVASCHKDPPPPPPVVVDAALPPTIASAPEVDAAIVEDAAVTTVPEAGVVSDAMMASSRDWKVLVRQEQGEGGMLSLDGLMRSIDRAVVAARSDAGASVRFVAYVDNTSDYGCVCPPWVFAPFWNTGRPDGYVYPTFAPGVPEAPLVKQGLMRFVGHFTGEKITGFEWLKRRHEKVDTEGSEEFAMKGPVMVVEGWCFEPADEYTSPALEEVYAKTLTKMQTDGRLCVGTHLPKHAPKD